MSYILDALKKSEQERGHGSVPGVQTIHSSSINYDNEKKSIWPLLLAALVFINIAGLAYFILTKEQSNAVANSHQLTSNNIVAESVKTYNSSDALKEVSAQPRAMAIIGQDTSLSQTTIKTDTTPDEIITTSSMEQTVAIEQPVETIDLHDIPLKIRQHIPAMEFSAHVYSSNASIRSIIINGRFMEEGDSIANDLVLTEITSDGAIFDFQGYRFSANVLSGWDIN